MQIENWKQEGSINPLLLFGFVNAIGDIFSPGYIMKKNGFAGRKRLNDSLARIVDIIEWSHAIHRNSSLLERAITRNIQNMQSFTLTLLASIKLYSLQPFILLFRNDNF